MPASISFVLANVSLTHYQNVYIYQGHLGVMWEEEQEHLGVMWEEEQGYLDVMWEEEQGHLVCGRKNKDT